MRARARVRRRCGGPAAPAAGPEAALQGAANRHEVGPPAGAQPHPLQGEHPRN
jgi:hypothetical protein